MNRRVILLFVLLALAVAASRTVYAQVDTGTILGTVKDETGAVVPNATVTLTNENTNFAIIKKTGPDGSYVFTPIQIGTYSVSAKSPGFQQAMQVHVTVNIQQQTVVNLTLVPGKVSQSVQVTAAPPLMQTQDASVQQDVTGRAINDLPLNGRNASFLARTAAGAVASYNAGRGLEASGSFSANGARSLQNNYMIDGIDNNAEIADLVNRTQFVVMPPPDALSEFTVQTDNYSAQFGHAEGAVLNATTKSGGNQLHGDLWEFVRNDKFDAADFFLNASQAQKAELRQNQFGFTLGGPVVIPHIYNGHNKTFFFGFYQGGRVRWGSSARPTVPTLAERSSGYTDFQDLLGSQGGTRTDILGRTFLFDTIFDPATTRHIKKGQVDPVTGLVAKANGYVRDPFYQGSLVGMTDFTGASAESLLNLIPASRLDPNAIKLLNLYPMPSLPGVFNNYVAQTVNSNDNNEFGARVDHNFSEKDTMFIRWIMSNTTNANPGPFPGLADGEAGRPGSGTTNAQNWALSETHVFSSNLINEARIGFSRLHDVRLQYDGNNLKNIPGEFGIQGIPQVTENGGLPTFNVNGLTNFGSATYLPSNKWSNTLQATENLTKIAGRHTIKVGGEFQNIRFPMITPPYSRGEFTYGGVYTSVVNEAVGTTGRAQFLLMPIAATVPNGVDNLGGMNQLQATNISPYSDLRRNYYAIYAEDDWRTTPNLTLNFGLRWEDFPRAEEHFGAQSNFVPGPGMTGGTLYFPASRANEVPQVFIDQLSLDGITFDPTSEPIWGNTPKKDFGPRFGFAYHALPNLVVRGGYAIFYGGFATLPLNSYGTSNFPFLVQSNFTSPNSTTPITPDNSIGSLENGLLNVPLDPATPTHLSAITLRGSQPDWKDDSSQNYNLTLQYELGKKTTLQTGYVGSITRHLALELPANTVSEMLPPGTKVVPYRFYPDFGNGGKEAWPWGNSNYNSLQVSLEHQAGNLYTLANFTWAKCRTNAGEPLLVGSQSGQAPYLTGFGPQYSTCLDGGVARSFNFSGVYNLPFGKGQRFLNRGGITNYLLGGWSTNWIMSIQDGQPMTIGCSISTTQGYGCNALFVPGQNPYQGEETPDRFLNAAAFTNPPVATTIGQTDFSPLGGAGTQVTGPPLHFLDFSLFKNIPISENTHLQFRAEAFNLTNTPSFANPAFTNFTDTVNFGKITGTVNNPREIQFALKFYF